METQQQRKIESSTDLLSPPFQKQKLKIKEKKGKQVQRRGGRDGKRPPRTVAVPLIKALSPIHSSKPVIFATRRVGTLVRAPAPRFIAG